VLECEYTQPASPTGRRCDPSDIRLSYHHTKLYQDPWLGGRFSGYAGIFLPTSFASINNNTIFNLRVSGAYMLRLLRNKLELSYSFGLQKYLPTSRRRSGVVSQADVSSSDGAMGSTGSGTGNNDNWLFVNGVHVGYAFTKRLSVSVDMLVYNYLRYEVEGLAKNPNAPVGKADWTWGVVEASYQPHKNIVVALGISSLQPALTADNKGLRFPFYDFISPENNFTKWYLSGTFIY